MAQSDGVFGHQSWSTEEGLPQNSVHQIFQSSDGYLWLATEGGVARFDGTSFKVLHHASDASFTSDDISSIAEDRDGVLWFGTADGLVRYEKGRTSRIGTVDGVSTAPVLSLGTGEDGALLVSTGAGVVRYDGKSFHRVSGAGEGLRGGGQARVALRGWSWIPQRVSNGGRSWSVGGEVPGTRIESFSVDREGDAWVGTNQGLAVLSPRWKTAKIVPELRADAVLCTFEDREGNHWIGTDTSGLHVLRVRKFGSDPLVAREAVTALVQTSDGAGWYATREDGLLRSFRGVVSKALDGMTALTLAPGSHGDLWVGTPDGLVHWENGVVRRFGTADGLPDEFVRSLLVARDGALWIGTRHGLAVLRDGRIAAVGAGNDPIGAVFEAGSDAGGDIWFGTLRGVTRIHGGEVREFGEKDGLAGGIVAGIAQDETGMVWVVSKSGSLNRFSGGRFLPVKSVDLPQDVVSMAADGRGFLWLQSRRGVARVAVAELGKCVGGAWCRVGVGRYGVADGMPSDETPEVGSPTIWKTADGHLWFATRRGVAVADAAHLPMNTVPPPMVVERFVVDGEVVPAGAEKVTLSPAHRQYTFDYAGLSYTVPSKVRYRFLLEGFDREWTDVGDRRTAYYTNLPFGGYRFRVQGANNDGVWNETGAEVRFSILRPFYRTWWFYVAMLGLSLAVVYLLYRARVRRLQTRFDLVLNERNRMAREIHDTLVQDFVGVSVQLELISRLVRSSRMEQVSQQLDRTRLLVREGLDAARQSIWNLRRGIGEDDLPARLGAAVERIIKSDASSDVSADVALDVHRKVVISGVYRPLPRATEEEILRVAQEALFNVERHARASAVSVELLYKDEGVELTVRDDGLGFVADAGRRAEGHYGLQGMKERAESLGAELQIESVRGGGTTVRMMVPIHEGQE